MEKESWKLNNTFELDKDKYYKKSNTKKIISIIFFFGIIYFIIMIILINIIFLLKNILKKYITSLENMDFYFENIKKQKKNINNSFNSDYYISRITYNNDIQFYKDLLKLYIENRTEFYIKGRERMMKLGGKHYIDSHISTIQDKLNWLIIHENPESKSNIVDKLLLHEYSKKILGKDICVPIIKIYNTSDEINFSELPDKFVLKCNHGSGMNILCNNKSKLNKTEAKKKLDNWMKINYGILGFEFQYLYIKRKIFAEKYLSDDICDFKVYCFNGKPKFIRVQKSLPDHSGKINNYYDLDWSLNDIETGLPYFFRKPEIKFEKPKNLDLMIEYSRKLSSDFCFVRIDLYEINNTVYLGEMTFTPSNCVFNCKNKNQSLYLGNMLDISKVKKKNGF